MSFEASLAWFRSFSSLSSGNLASTKMHLWLLGVPLSFIRGGKITDSWTWPGKLVQIWSRVLTPLVAPVFTNSNVTGPSSAQFMSKRLRLPATTHRGSRNATLVAAISSARASQRAVFSWTLELGGIYTVNTTTFLPIFQIFPTAQII